MRGRQGTCSRAGCPWPPSPSAYLPEFCCCSAFTLVLVDAYATFLLSVEAVPGWPASSRTGSGQQRGEGALRPREDLNWAHSCTTHRALLGDHINNASWAFPQKALQQLFISFPQPPWKKKKPQTYGNRQTKCPSPMSRAAT